MQRIFTLATAFVCLTTTGAVMVGNRVETVTVSEESVTATIQPIKAVTVPESAVAYKEVSFKEVTRNELVDAVRGGGDRKHRLAALEQVWDQDDIFYLFFKPGEDGDIVVRGLAAERIAEIEVLKSLAGKSGSAEVNDIIAKRIASVYQSATDRKVVTASHVAAEYAKRMKARR